MSVAFRPDRPDLQLIADMIAPGSRLLDIGCGDGTLLAWLAENKNVDGRGIELSMEGVSNCVGNGLSVIQGDADTDLDDYPEDAFDYAVLSQTLQATKNPRGVLRNLVRIGRNAIVSFPNFGYWRIRANLLFCGRMPETEALPHKWYDTKNIHLCTILDFRDLCRAEGAMVEHATAFDHRQRPMAADSRLANWTATGGIFRLRRMV